LKTVGEAMIAENIPKIPQESVRIETIKRLKEIEDGIRDLYF